MNQNLKKRIESINKGIIPEGYKKTKVGIVPVEWETTSLGNYIVEHTEKSTENNQYPVLTSSRRGIFLQSDYYNKQVASEDNTGYNVVPLGYFTYRHMSDDEVFRFNINNIVKKGIVSTLYPVFTTHNLDDNWLLNTLNNGHEFQKYALIQKQGGSRTYMYLEKLKKLKLAIPPLPEQQKIAEILSTQDKLIELQERKINQLKTLKKGYLQKMFPKKGSKFPELRFKGFTDAWEQRKLGDVCQITMGQSPDGSTYSDTESDYILVQGNADLKDGWVFPRIWTTQKTKTADAGDLIMSVRAPAGAMGKTAYDIVLGRGVAGIKGNEFIFQTLVKMDSDGYWKKLAAGSTFESINSDAVKNAEILTPTREEQEKIGEYFSQLDSLITLHQRKSEQEKQKKKALMQLLLTGKVRVKL